MRRANQAIIRECQPIPTIEEVLQDLNGNTVVSGVNLKWGLHQRADMRQLLLSTGTFTDIRKDYVFANVGRVALIFQQT